MNQVKEYQGAYNTTFGLVEYRFIGTEEDHRKFKEAKQRIFSDSLKGPNAKR